MLPVVLVFALLFALVVIPPLGALVGILSPFPLVFIFLQRGKQVALVLMTLIFGVLWFLVGQNQALLFMGEYAVMAFVLGEMIRARFPGDWCIGASSLISGGISILLLVALLGDQDTTVKGFFENMKSNNTLKNSFKKPNNLTVLTAKNKGKHDRMIPSLEGYDEYTIFEQNLDYLS